MDGFRALDIWDLVIELLHSSKNQPEQADLLSDEAQRKHTNTKTKTHTIRHDIELVSVDHVIKNAKPPHFGAFSYILEDNEAAIKMTINSRSPTMRHVSRTCRVALDWLFDRINLDSKTQIEIRRYQKPNRRHVDEMTSHW